MTVLNTIVADQLEKFKVSVDKRISKGVGKDESILKELQVLIKKAKRLFDLKAMATANLG